MRWQRVSPLHRIFDKDQQRVTHAAVTENKRLSEVLALAMALQQAGPPQVPRAGKGERSIRLAGRRNDGWNSKAAKPAKRNVAGQPNTDIDAAE